MFFSPPVKNVKGAQSSESYQLSALHTLVTLSGSALIGLAVAHGHLDADSAFDAAHLVVLTQALIDAGLSDQQIAKVMGGNMMRYLSQTL